MANSGSVEVEEGGVGRRKSRELDKFNLCRSDAAVEWLLDCCGSQRWARRVEARRPFSSEEDLLTASSDEWQNGGLQEGDFLEAFSHHPKIGEASNATTTTTTTAITDTTKDSYAAEEQKSVFEADTKTLKDLRRLNIEYLQKNGFIYIVCATGLSAEQMLDRLRQRMTKTRAEELKNACDQQRRITALRIRKKLLAQTHHHQSASSDQSSNHLSDTAPSNANAHL